MSFYRTSDDYQFYSQKIGSVIFYLNILIILECFIIGIYAFRGYNEAHVYALNSKGQLTALEPWNINNNEHIKNYLIDGLNNFYNFSHETYKNQINFNQSYLTQDGYKKYVNTLINLNIPAYIKDGPVFLSSSIQNILPDQKSTGVFNNTQVYGFIVTIEHNIKTSKNNFTIQGNYQINLSVLPNYTNNIGLKIYNISNKTNI